MNWIYILFIIYYSFGALNYMYIVTTNKKRVVNQYSIIEDQHYRDEASYLEDISYIN